jgi:predicted flap endonuclease-1-like 5' DNA nuclease
MRSTYDTLINLAFVWGIASLTGFGVMAALMILGDWGIMQGLFAAAIIFFGLGSLLSFLFLKPLPGPQRPGTAGWGGGTTSAARTAPAATPARATAATAAAPRAEASTSPSAAGEAARPAALDAPRDSGADDLKKIKGIGPKLEELCNELGFYHYDQIANWTPEEVAWVDDNLEGFKGRVTRDNWIEQARTLMAEKGTGDSPNAG